MALKKCLGKKARALLKHSHITANQLDTLRLGRFCNNDNRIICMGRRVGKTLLVKTYAKYAHRGTVLANSIHYRNGLLANAAYFSEA